MEVTEKINKLVSSWEEFKAKNSIEECQDRIDKMEAYLGRPVQERRYNNEYKENFVEYLRKGITNNNMSYMGNAKSGFPLEWDMSDKVLGILADLSVLRKICDVETISGDYMTYIYDKSNFKAEWSAKTTSAKASDIEEFKLINIYSYPLYSQPKTTQSILDDSTIDLEKWLVEKISIAFSKQENVAFINGADADAPKGILIYAEDSVNERKIENVRCRANDVISMDDIIRLYYALPTEYAVNGAFLMHRSTVQYLRSIRSDRGDQYMWQPSFKQSTPDTLMGVPVYECNEMPDFSRGMYTIIFADFKRAYKIVDRKGINIMRDPYSYKPYVSFYATKRVGGDLVDSNAIRVLKMSRATRQ